MALLLDLGLRINKNKGIVVGMQDHFLTQDVMYPLLKGLNKTIEFLFIRVLVDFSICKCFRMVGNGMTSLFKYNTNRILTDIKIHMLLPCNIVNHNIIEIDDDNLAQMFPKNIIDKAHKRSRSIGQVERHDQPFI